MGLGLARAYSGSWMLTLFNGMDAVMPCTKCFQLGILDQDFTLNVFSHSPRGIWSMTMDSAYDTVLEHLQVVLKL